MQNRRNDYRHTFIPEDRLHVEITRFATDPTLSGEVVDLSVGGMSVDLATHAHHLRQEDRCYAHFTIPHGLQSFALEAVVIHTCRNEAGGQLGLRFLPQRDLNAQDETDRALWVFLLDEQRRQRRLRQARP